MEWLLLAVFGFCVWALVRGTRYRRKIGLKWYQSIPRELMPQLKEPPVPRPAKKPKKRTGFDYDEPLMKPKKTTLVSAAGAWHYRDFIEIALGGVPEDSYVSERMIVLFVPEPFNEHDSNAIALYTTYGSQIGYVARSDTDKVHPLIERIPEGKTLSGMATLFARRWNGELRGAEVQLLRADGVIDSQ